MSPTDGSETERLGWWAAAVAQARNRTRGMLNWPDPFAPAAPGSTISHPPRHSNNNSFWRHIRPAFPRGAKRARHKAVTCARTHTDMKIRHSAEGRAVLYVRCISDLAPLEDKGRMNSGFGWRRLGLLRGLVAQVKAAVIVSDALARAAAAAGARGAYATRSAGTISARANGTGARPTALSTSARIQSLRSAISGRAAARGRCNMK